MTGSVWLFSYGTLRQAEVQRAVFGREVECVEDALAGFELNMITITDAAVIKTSGSDRHPILKRSSSDRQVRGAALCLNESDLRAADRYEVADYVRVPVVLASGRAAFVYMARAGPAA